MHTAKTAWPPGLGLDKLQVVPLLAWPVAHAHCDPFYSWCTAINVARPVHASGYDNRHGSDMVVKA